MQDSTRRTSLHWSALHLTYGLSAIALAAGLGFGVNVGAACAQAAPAASQPTPSIGEVVVTARRREESMQSTPVAVSALSGEALARKTITTVDDIQFHVPELQVNPSQYLLSAEPAFTLRGLSTTVPGTTIADTSVASYLGDVPLLYTRDIGHSLYDLQSVEVLRGPQGTLFGKNSTGGAVIFNPVRPGKSFDGFVSGNFGDYGLVEVSGAVTVPLTDSLRVRLSANIGRRDGYTKNYLGPDLNDENFNSGRLSVVYSPTDRFENYAFIDWTDSQENIVAKETTAVGGPALGLYTSGAAGAFTNPALGAFSNVLAQVARQQAIGPDKVYTTDPNFVNIRAYTASNVTTFHLNDSLTFKNILTHQRSKSLFVLNNGSLLYDFAAPLNNPDFATQTSDEVQVLGTAFDKKLDWLFGVFMSKQDDDNFNHNQIFNNYNPAFNFLIPAALIHDITAQSTDKTVGIYGHATYDLGALMHGLSFSAGYRYTWDTRTLDLDFKTLSANFATFSMVPSCALAGLVYPNCASHFSKRFSEPSWTIGLDEKLTDKVLVYVASRRGFKSGGFNATSGIPGTQLYEPETITDVEAGVKADWRVGEMPVRTNLTLFHGKLKGSSVPLLPVYQGNIYQVIQNVKGATIQGVEFEFNLQPTRQIDLSGSYSLTDSSYDDGSKIVTLYGPGGVAAAFQDLSGTPVTQASRHTAQFSASYDFDIDPKWGDLRASADYAWRSEQLIPGQGGGDAVLPAFGILNLRADLHNIGGKGVDFAVWVKNVADKRYLTTEQLFRNVLGADQVTYGNPRQVGVTVSYRFGS